MKALKLIVMVLGIMIIVWPQVGWPEEEAEEVIKLEELVVSSPRIDRKLVETPASISIITAAEIEEMGVNNIVDVVENIPGVVEDSDTRNRVTFRGNRSVQSAGVLVLVDGVPANTGISGYVEYPAIPLADIERVEVLRSSGAVVFGPDASRGVINIITKKGKVGPPLVELSGSYGSWDTWEEGATITGRIGDWDYGLGGSRLDTDGYEDEERERNAARLNIGYNFSDDTRLGLNLAWRDIDYDTAQKKTEWQVENYRRESVFPKSETDPTLEHYRQDEDENIAAGLDFTHKTEDLFAKAFVSYYHTDHLYRMYDDHLNAASIKNDYEEDRDEDRFLARASGGYSFDLAQIVYTPTLGVDYEETNFDQKRTYPWAVPGSKATSIAKANIDSQRERWGIFLSNDLEFGGGWELSVSGRADHVEYDVRSEEPKQVTSDTTDYSWNVIPAFHPNKDSTIYASVSRSYWYPVLIYYKYAMEKGSPLCRAEDLGAEEYLTYELGYKHYLGSRLSVALTGYLMNVRDRYMSIYDDAGDWQGYKNIGESEHKGVEVEATGILSPYFGYRLSGAYQRAEWDEATFKAYVWYPDPANDRLQLVDISGKKVPHVPDLTSTIGLDFYFLEDFKFSTDLNYYGSQYIDVLNRYEMNNYVTVDAIVSYSQKKYKIWVLGTNLFDREVENIFNERGRRNPDGSPRHYAYYPLDGRYVEVGVTFTF